MTRDGTEDPRTSGKGSRLLPAGLILCVAVVGFWEYMSHRSLRPYAEYRIRIESFAGFQWDRRAWKITDITVASDDPTAPTMLSFAVESREWPPAILRLTHGYNMPECMEIKGYQTQLVGDQRAVGGCQLWQIVSDVQVTSVWTTAMISSSDLSITGLDTREMPFPRVLSGENAKWVPRGITWGSLRHPIRGLKAFLADRWNASRSDLGTFLKLRQPAMASDEILTAVINMNLPAKSDDSTRTAALKHIISVNAAFLEELQIWRTRNPDAW